MILSIGAHYPFALSNGPWSEGGTDVFLGLFMLKIRGDVDTPWGSGHHVTA